MKLRSAGVNGATTLRGAEMTRGKPSRWPWMVIAALFGLIALLLKLGSGADADPQGAYHRLEPVGPGADVYSQPDHEASATAAVKGSGQVTESTGALPMPNGENGSGGSSGGITGWISNLFGHDSEPSAMSAETGSRGGVIRTTSPVVPGVVSAAPVASAAATTTAHTLSNDQLMQPGDDSAFLKDGEPGEEAGGGSQY
ncbi:hypothetical protein EV700_1331 [Fluviicoccus keumensis]|uniref:Uncharacterized protein n=1 Tax=Fluviicoccus keumensis TaxID=1435465 RepID=A0A4Q7ZAL5_9GAMM|nr:hypothetical protein [Fluviicoccus keumensis]RZU46945.1 hypothetical protein EV700_1331 [Fluviicoccus keumensis]